MKIQGIFSVILFMINSLNVYACDLGDAKVGEGINGKALLICHPGIVGNSFQSIQGVQLFSFFDAHKNDSEFKRRAENTVGMSYDNIINSLKDDYAVIELFSEDIPGLQYLAKKYSTWTGADRRKADEQSESTATPLAADRLEGLVSQNKSLIQSVNSRSCSEVKGNAHIIRIDFQDGELVNLLPVDLNPIPGKPERYELSFIRPYMGISFYYKNEVEKREIIIPKTGDIQWVHKGTSYPIRRDNGLQLYGSFATAGGRTSNNCELQKVVSNVSYGTKALGVEQRAIK